MKESVGIVGGGISGLYAAYRLLALGFTDITIYERERVGGRIHTIQVPDEHQKTIELGAGRISTGHKRVLTLARELGLKVNFYDKLVVDYYQDGQKIDSDIRQKMLDACDELRRKSREFLMSRTLRIALLDVVSASDIQTMQACFGYDLEFDINAWHALHTMRHDIGPGIRFCGIVGGYGKLHEALRRRCRVKFVMQEVTQFHRGTPHIFVTESGKHRHDLAFFCVTKRDLEKLDIAGHDAGLAASLRVLMESPLIRIYTRCPSIEKAFPRRTSTNTVLRQILPVAPGLSMICYADAQNATQWAEWGRANQLKKELRRYLKIATGFEFRPKWIISKYWECGVHGWKPFPVRYIRKNRDMFVCGECVAWHHHAWVEGALASVDEVFAQFFSD